MFVNYTTYYCGVGDWEGGVVETLTLPLVLNRYEMELSLSVMYCKEIHSRALSSVEIYVRDFMDVLIIMSDDRHAVCRSNTPLN